MTKMNGIRRSASEAVQRATASVARMIGEPFDHRDQAHDAISQVRLNPIRWARVSPPIARARVANDRPAHAPLASLMAVGWRALNFSRAKVTG
jgi:hypothetical protein